MKKSLLTLTAVLAFGSLASFAQTEDKTETFNAVASTWVRQNNETWKPSNANDQKKIVTEIQENKDGDQVVGYYYFAGLLGFDYSVPEGMRVKSATLTLVTERKKGGNVFIRAFENNFANNATWQNESQYIETALATEPIVEFTAKGQSNMAIWDSSKSGYQDTFKNLAAWTNDIDITSYMKSLKSTTTRVNFIFTQQADKKRDQVNFYSSQATDENESFTLGEESIAGSKLVPYITVVFEEDIATSTVVVSPIADTFVRSNAAATKYGSNTTMEIYWNGEEVNRDPQFYGLMSFSNLPAELNSNEYELKEATLRLVTNQLNNGDHNMQIYEYPDVVNQADATWNNTNSSITTALNAEPICEFTAAGQNNKRMDDGGINDSYKNVAAWTNYIDLTNYLKSKEDRTQFNILLSKKVAADKAIRICSSESQDIQNTKTDSDNPFTFAADDLKPQLKLLYTKLGTTVEVETIIVDSNAPVEYYNLQGVKVTNPEKGIYIMRQGTSVRKVIL